MQLLMMVVFTNNVVWSFPFLYALTPFAFITKIAKDSQISNNMVTEMLLPPLVARIDSLREDLERKMAVTM